MATESMGLANPQVRKVRHYLFAIFIPSFCFVRTQLFFYNTHISLNFFQFHLSSSPSPAPTIRASDFPRRKTLFQRLLAHLSCTSNNVLNVHDETIPEKLTHEDDDDCSLLIYTARGRGQAEATHSKPQWQVSE